MNAKKCKKFRRIARGMGLELPARELLAKPTKKRVIWVEGKNKHSRIEVQAINSMKSVRGIYRALKKGELIVSNNGVVREAA